jgi:hypothetical protein
MIFSGPEERVFHLACPLDHPDFFVPPHNLKGRASKSLFQTAWDRFSLGAVMTN